MRTRGGVLTGDGEWGEEEEVELEEREDEDEGGVLTGDGEWGEEEEVDVEEREDEDEGGVLTEDGEWGEEEEVDVEEREDEDEGGCTHRRWRVRWGGRGRCRGTWSRWGSLRSENGHIIIIIAEMAVFTWLATS